MNTSKKLAVITARGNSKRIPDKNIRLFCGKPILLYSIQAALESKLFEEVMVSTDDPRIAELALKAGASVPFLRSDENSDDFATTTQVLCEVIEQYKSNGKQWDMICCLYPTAVFVSAEKLKKADAIFSSSGAATLVPVVEFSFPPMRGFEMTDQGWLQMKWPEYMFTRSQDMQPIYHDAGQFYFLRVADFLKNRAVFTDKTIPFVVPETEVQDIDNETDWAIAEMKYRIMESNN